MSRQERAQEAGRKERVPLGTPRRKLSLESGQDPNRSYRWINDSPGRLDAAIEGGYRFEQRKTTTAIGGDGSAGLQTETDTRISRVVGTGQDGQGMRAYLMSIDKGTYDADQKTKFDEIDETERAIQRTGKADPNEKPDEHDYVPLKMTRPITVQHERR